MDIKTRFLVISLLVVFTVFLFGCEVGGKRTVKQDISTIQLGTPVKPMDYKAYLAELVGIVNEWEKGYTGKGVTVAVLDSGVYPHPDLTKPENRIIAFKDFVSNKDKPYDDYGHGTFVTGIIAGNGNLSGGRYKGLAPDAKIVGVKVLSIDGGGSVENIIQGIDWVIANKNKYNIKILNLSVGQNVDKTTTSDQLSLKAEEAVDNGIIVITSVGNRESSSFDRYSPAISPKVIAVGSADNSGSEQISNLRVADFSSHWSEPNSNITKPDLITFGKSIVSLESDYWYDPERKDDLRKDVSYVNGEGTSASAAIITGITAVLLQHYPDKTVDEIKEILKMNSIKISDSEEAQGWGLISLK